MIIEAEAPPIKDEWLGIQEIDPQNPPRNGLWMNWEDAYAMAIYNRKQRVNYETSLINANKDREIFKRELETTRKQLADANSPAKSWWLTWGFPIGLGIGVLLGIVVPLTTQGVQNGK